MGSLRAWVCDGGGARVAPGGAVSSEPSTSGICGLRIVRYAILALENNTKGMLYKFWKAEGRIEWDDSSKINTTYECRLIFIETVEWLQKLYQHHGMNWFDTQNVKIWPSIKLVCCTITWVYNAPSSHLKDSGSGCLFSVSAVACGPLWWPDSAAWRRASLSGSPPSSDHTAPTLYTQGDYCSLKHPIYFYLSTDLFFI